MSFGDFFGGYSLIDGTTSGKENLGELISELHNGGVAINCKFDAGKEQWESWEGEIQVEKFFNPSGSAAAR